MAFDAGLVARIDDALVRMGRRGMRQKNVFSGRGFLAGSTAFVIAWGAHRCARARSAWTRA